MPSLKTETGKATWVLLHSRIRNFHRPVSEGEEQSPGLMELAAREERRQEARDRQAGRRPQ